MGRRSVRRAIFLFAFCISLLTVVYSTPLKVVIDYPSNATSNDPVPHLSVTTDEASDITYSWDGGGNISGCRNCTTFTTTYGEALPDPSTVLLLHFNENHGTVVFDSSSKGNDGVLLGGVRGDEWISGKFGSALNFNGANYVEISHGDSLDMIENLTIIAWIRPRPVDLNRAWVTVLEKFDDEWGLYIHLGKVTMLTSMTVTVSLGGSTVMTADRWYCIAGVRDGEVMSAYLNGLLDGIEQRAGFENITFKQNSLVIGGNSEDSWFTGDIDELAVYDRALSAGEISQLCNKSLSDGLHRVEVHAKGSEGLTRAVRYFTVDKRQPRISLNAPGNGSIQASNVVFSWTSYDEGNNMSSDLTIDGVVIRHAIPTPNGTHTTIALEGLAPGMHDWSVTSWDDAGNSNTTATWSFIADSSPPKYVIFGNSPLAPNPGEKVTCYSLWTDDRALSSALIEENTSGMKRNHSIDILNGWANYTFSADVLKAGMVRCRIIVKDSAGNTNSTPDLTFSVPDYGPFGIKKWLRRICYWIRLCPIE